MPLSTEVKRLTELYALNILDSEPEAIFDSIVDMVKDMFDMPVVLISLVDVNRQWFKACYGVDVNQMPRNLAFCSYTILSDNVMVVPDATKDERFKDNPLVTGEPHIRFYAGAPLITETGSKIGTLCIVDMIPHDDFDEKKQLILSKMAKIAMERIILRVSLKELQLASRGKNDFFAHLSHEIRTPLGAVVGCIQLLDKLGPLNEKQVKLFETLQVASDNLYSLVNDHLDFSKMENSQTDLHLRSEPVNYSSLMNDIQKMLGNQAEMKNLNLVFDTAVLEKSTIKSDETRLRQILINLVSNSIKYTKQGTVKLSARLEQKHKDAAQMIFDVSDTGIGIPANELEKIFNVYERSSDKQNAIIKGTGLGLAITKRLVELMGGSISVQSVVNKGSTFTVALPVTIESNTPEYAAAQKLFA